MSVSQSPWRRRVALLSIVPILAVSGATARAAQQQQQVELSKEGLSLVAPANLPLTPAGLNGWRSRVGESTVEVSIELMELPGAAAEPDLIADAMVSAWTNPDEDGKIEFELASSHVLRGETGYAHFAIATVCRSTEQVDGRPQTQRIALAGLLPTKGYALVLDASPPLPDADASKLVADLGKGLRYRGERREWKWTDAEAKERWERDAPAATHEKYEGAIRTAHYLILTNSSGGKLFAKKMEECYATIRKVYPFEEVEERRLMPVFLFRTPEEYYAFYAKIAGISTEAAERSKGHAWRDYYATWYEAPNDPVHIHEATHQIFSNRLYLTGGGSWFQEGVAEYVETKPGDRSAAATAVKKGRHMPLEQFVTLESLLYAGDEDDPQGDAAGDLYKQAAVLIEFLRESPFGKAGFPRFLYRIGNTADDDPKAIERAVRDVYGVDLAGLEEKWIAYCKKR